jgi:Leucine-rich repeat (LRR) protein
MLTEEKIKNGFWYWDQKNNHPPKGITLVEDYRNSEKLNLVITQLDTEKKHENKIIDTWCKKLPELSEIKYLWFSSRVNQKIFDAVCQLSNIEGLYIKWSGVKNIDSIQNLNKLRYLWLGSSAQVEDIEALGKLSNLITLELENFKKISDFSIVSNIRKLEGLGLNGSTWTPQKINTLEPIKHLTELKYLSAINSKILDKSFEPILSLKKLVRFSVSWNYPSEEFEKLRKLPNLKYNSQIFIN